MVQSVLNLIANTAKLTSTSAYSLFPTKKHLLAENWQKVLYIIIFKC